MRVIDGKNTVLGRLASYAAKEALKGEDIVVVNCDEVIITGNRKDILEEFFARRRRVGSSQKGLKYSRSSERIVKRAIRGMLPNHRRGIGKAAFKRIKCYSGIPQEFENSEKISLGSKPKIKFMKVSEIFK